MTSSRVFHPPFFLWTDERAILQGAYDKLACADGVPSMLAVGRSFKCSPAMSIAQSDIDAGLVRNTARCVRLVSGS